MRDESFLSPTLAERIKPRPVYPVRSYALFLGILARLRGVYPALCCGVLAEAKQKNFLNPVRDLFSLFLFFTLVISNGVNIF